MSGESVRDFFNNNDVKVGEGKDFKVTPPLHYSSLREAVNNYFQTFRWKKQNLGILLTEEDWDRKQLAFNLTGHDDKLISSILDFHRFFELHIKDILRRVNPFLAVKMFEKEEEVFSFISQKLNADDVKTIEYGETIKRFKQAYKHYDKESETYKAHLLPYEFLNSPDNLESLNILSEWRNRIMHNGMTFPNMIAFEYLVSQRIIPIIQKIIEADMANLNGQFPFYFQTPTGINILEQIIAIKFDPTDVSTANMRRELGLNLLKLQHLKELGRASYNQNPLIRKNSLYYEHLYENPIARTERFAKSESEYRKDIFFSLNKCLCCGANSLVVYRQEYDDFFTNTRKFNSWFKCFNCDYSLPANVLDPNYFGLSNEPIFPIE